MKKIKFQRESPLVKEQTAAEEGGAVLREVPADEVRQRRCPLRPTDDPVQGWSGIFIFVRVPVAEWLSHWLLTSRIASWSQQPALHEIFWLLGKL